MRTSSELRPKKYGGSFGFQYIVASICRAEATTVSRERRENLGAFPPFPEWEEVLARDTSDPAIDNGSFLCEGVFELVAKLITIVGEVSPKPGPVPQMMAQVVLESSLGWFPWGNFLQKFLLHYCTYFYADYNFL